MNTQKYRGGHKSFYPVPNNYKYKQIAMLFIITDSALYCFTKAAVILFVQYWYGMTSNSSAANFCIRAVV